MATDKLADAVDWSQFEPVETPGLAPVPASNLSPDVDWSQFTPAEISAAGPQTKIEAEVEPWTSDIQYDLNHLARSPKKFHPEYENPDAKTGDLTDILGSATSQALNTGSHAYRGLLAAHAGLRELTTPQYVKDLDPEFNDAAFAAIDQQREVEAGLHRPNSNLGAFAGGALAGFGPSGILSMMTGGQDVIAEGGTVAAALKQQAIDAALAEASAGTGMLGRSAPSRVALQGGTQVGLGAAARKLEGHDALDPGAMGSDFATGAFGALFPNGRERAPEAPPPPRGGPDITGDAGYYETKRPGTPPLVEPAPPNAREQAAFHDGKRVADELVGSTDAVSPRVEAPPPETEPAPENAAPAVAPEAVESNTRQIGEPIQGGSKILFRGDPDALNAQLDAAGQPRGLVMVQDGEPVGIYVPKNRAADVANLLENTNATEARQQPENDQQQYQDRNPGRTEAEAGGGNRVPEGGQDKAPEIDSFDIDSFDHYHGGPSPLHEINSGGLFGGLFGASSKSAALSHGDVLHGLRSPKPLSDHDLNYEIEGAYGHALKLAHGDEEVADSIMSADTPVPEKLSGKDDGEISWELQRLRGKLASELGYTSVEMLDEHGTTWLYLPGSEVVPFTKESGEWVAQGRRQQESRQEPQAEVAPAAPSARVQPESSAETPPKAAHPLGRLGELLDHRDRLSTGEQGELVNLLAEDRLRPKVGGRNLPEGIHNMTAMAEAEARGELGGDSGFADADNFKRTNDRLGHETGDQVIHTMAEVFRDALHEQNPAARVYSRGGDEFVFRNATKDQIHAAMTKASERLSGIELSAVDKDGNVQTQKGVRFSYGTGENPKSAEDAQYRDKQDRAARGLRTERATDAERVVAEPAQPGIPPGADRGQASTKVVPFVPRETSTVSSAPAEGAKVLEHSTTAAPDEPAANDENVTGIKHAKVAEERALKQKDELHYEGKRTFGDAWDSASEKLKKDPAYATTLAKVIVEKPRALNAEESAALIQDRMRIQNWHRKFVEEASSAMESGDIEREAHARAAMMDLEGQLEISDQASKASGYEQGFGLAARRMMAKEDYTMAAVATRAKVAAERPITHEERAKLEALTKRVEELDAQLAEQQKARAESRARPVSPKAKKSADDEFKALAARLKAIRAEEQLIPGCTV